jgi:lipopolysaccharide transport system ATP-binding protein
MTVIRVESLSKQYRLGMIGGATLREDLSRWWALKRGKDDPLAKVGGGAKRPAQIGERFWALKDVSFEVKQGEILGIIGRNGAGKSTLLKILSRITAPTEGVVKVKGRIGSLLEVGTGFHPELTGRENIYLNGAILGMNRREVDRKLDEIIAFSEVEQFIDTPVKRYSSGMYVRLAFAVAAHLDPEILIVDEVLAVGDAAFQKKCLGKMGEVAGEGRTVLFVSHNMASVRDLCTRCALLVQARLELDSSAEAAISRHIGDIWLSAGHRLAVRRDRGGQGRVRLTRIWAGLGGDAERVTIVSGGAVSLYLELTEVRDDLRCQLSLYNSSGQIVLHFDSTGSDSTVPDGTDGPSTMVCDIPRLLLTPGRYWVNACISDARGTQDHVEGALVLDVTEGYIAGRRSRSRSVGMAVVPSSWARRGSTQGPGDSGQVALA